ncbi:MAG: leucine-rich repeat domain-containing protein, partial [Clostridiales bacterium]|nr:leucine-rich repeat domain-containing protein [Clostridiales bacterium]
DPQVTGEIKIIKRIKISDIVFAHGNPTFIFKVENDKTGQTYYKSITFSEEYVEDFIEKNPSEKYIEQSVTLSGLPVGKYRISEVDTLRYTRAPEYIVTPYEVKDDDNVVTLTYSDLKLETKFTNIKEKQSSTTHTAQLTNILKRDRKLTAVVAVWRGPKIVETETLETSSLDVYAVYDDGNQVKLNSDDYELDPETFDPSMNGERSVKVTYEEEGIVRSDTFIITIKVSLPFTWEKVVEYETPIVGDDGVKYYGEVTVTGYLGSSTIIDIPSKVDGIRETEDTHIDKGKTYKVTGVGDENGRNTTNSFIYKDEDLNGVTIRIPNGIKIIYGYAFAGDERITGIQFPDSLEEIEVSAFNMSGLIGELKLPPNLKTIGSYAFKGCGFTGTLTLGNSLETISIGAFVECKFTGNLVIPDTVKTINSYAFDNGGNSRKAFEGGILSLPNNAEFKTIGWNTFRNCGFIGDLVIPDSVEIIEGNAFHRCTFKGKLTLGSNLKTVGYQSFYLCGFNGSLNIPDLVIDIGDQAFAGVAGFSSLTFGSKVKTIGSNSFASTGITSLSIPNTVTEIRANAFGNCTSLGGTVRIPNSVTVLGNAVFLYCINLAEVQLPSRLAPYEPGYARITVTYYD